MDINFHYYCIAVLAKASGMSTDDALTVAYASQYTDEATESKPIEVNGMMFDPVRTAHIGLEAYDWGVQKRVYIPFHFLPPNEITHSNDTFVVEKCSPFAKKLWHHALEPQNKLRRLCAMGIALHTFADTWAHQGFSGRRNRENDVESISTIKNRKWDMPVWENIYLDMLPQIGHAEAGHYPDQSPTEWKCSRPGLASSPNWVPTMKRSNTDEFLDAAKEIFSLLKNAVHRKRRSKFTWQSLKPMIREALAEPSENDNQCYHKWKKKFGFLFSDDAPLKKFDPYQWRTEALRPKKREEIKWSNAGDTEGLHFTGGKNFNSTPWVQFHRAALQQRHFVLEHIF